MKRSPSQRSGPAILKRGTIDCDLAETTPIVFQQRLFRFEYVRENYHANRTGTSYFRFIDVATGRETPPFGHGYHLGSAIVANDAVYVMAVERWGGSVITVFRSPDLETWEAQEGLRLPGWGLYNNSVCQEQDGYVMAIEVGEPAEVVGIRFTIFFAHSHDLLRWQLLPPEHHVFGKDRYAACPALRYVDGWYYMIYLEERSGPCYVPYITRSRDLVRWMSSPFNPIIAFSDEDRRIASRDLTPEQQERIRKAININNSDVDLCEYRERTVLYYSWGNQQGIEFLAQAEYEGPLFNFLQSYFAA